MSNALIRAIQNQKVVVFIENYLPEYKDMFNSEQIDAITDIIYEIRKNFFFK